MTTRTKRTLAGFFIFVSMMTLAGCADPFGGKHSHIDDGHNPGLGDSSSPPLPFGKGTEFVAGSIQNQNSLNQTHKISATLGSPASGLKLTTVNGKTLYSNVQGEFLSQ